MATTTLPSRKAKIVAASITIELDASIEEVHTTTSQVTRHPVEEGADVADHVRPDPDGLRMTGIISNHFLEKTVPGAENIDPERQFLRRRAGGEDLVLTNGPDAPDPERADVAFEQLRLLQTNRELVTVITTLRAYEDMVLTSLEVPRNVKLGNVVRFNATFETIRRVASERVAGGTPDTDLQRAKPRVSQGKKPATPASEASNSYARNLLNGL